MNEAETIVRLQEVGLCYRLAKQRIPSIKEYAIHWMKGALDYEKLWALQEVDLEVRRRETLGIIGRNGAGKSTLLKVISGVLKPSRGRVETAGRIAPILELGMGFDGELSGTENVYLNALLLGRTKSEIAERFDGIVAFSGLGDFIRSPVRNYSTGMLARLGFSIATAWTPDLLILDEVLAVGDSRFVQRCVERIEELKAEGATLMMVSHSAEAIRANCKRCLWIDRGKVMADGPTGEVLERYIDFATHPDG